MRLSNPLVWFVILSVFGLSTMACWWSATDDPSPGNAMPPAKSRFPFPTVEPDVYQADVILSAGSDEQKFFIARKNGLSRMDLDVGTKAEIIEIRGDKILLLHTSSKTFTEVDRPAELTSDPNAIGVKRLPFLQDIEYRQYDEIETVDGVIKYKTRPIEDGDADIFVWFDTKLGLIVRQEFTDRGDDGTDLTRMRFVYELRNARLEADDSLFAVPEGYRKVSRSEFFAATRKIKE